MKKGLMVYKTNYDKFNIGDYIQSLAAKQFLNQPIDYFINREYLNTFDKDDVYLIMNGWFTHYPENWPPSSKIHPIFVAFHVSSLCKDKLLNEVGVEYLKKYEPIGCRDYATVNYLKERGINAYFSGCLTLTLGLTYKSKDKDDKIYFVDPYIYKDKSINSICTVLLLIIAKGPILFKLLKKMYGKINKHNFISTVFFYYNYRTIFTDECLLSSEYIQHQIPNTTIPSEEDRFKVAETLLDKYAKAKFVITSRIHCALPCLSLGTPVLYIENVNQQEWSLCRLKGLIEHLNIISNNKGELKLNFSFYNKKINANSIFSNKNTHITIRDGLITTVKKALNQ